MPAWCVVISCYCYKVKTWDWSHRHSMFLPLSRNRKLSLRAVKSKARFKSSFLWTPSVQLWYFLTVEQSRIKHVWEFIFILVEVKLNSVQLSSIQELQNTSLHLLKSRISGRGPHPMYVWPRANWKLIMFRTFLCDFLPFCLAAALPL